MLYSYDVFGNVDTLLQDINQGSMKATGNRFKKIIYNYDVISGKVNSVAYQKGSKDQFYHRYSYDAENRLTQVYTSIDGIYYERDATYEYYKHGPLGRTVLGQLQVQALKNAYTLQGWLKGIVPDTNKSMIVAKPVFDYTLHYFGGDYKAINATPFTVVTVDKFRPLYNGNIGAMLVNVPKIGEMILHNYHYDQLNRLTGVSNYNGYDKVSNSWKATEEHKERLSYDANGNIQTALLNGNTAKLNYENYKYDYDAIKKNRLLSINNSIDGKKYIYDYDSIGNVIKDGLEGNKELSWNIYGKLSKVVKEDGTVIDFSYDAAGNRISKRVGNKEQWYVRDAQGNIMATYVKDAAINKGKLSSESYYKYGSNMLGAWNKVRDVETAFPVIDGLLVRDEQEYYLGNHLGNNLAIVSDRKIQNDNNGDGLVDDYSADIVKATDYSAFGENLMGKEFNGNKIKYGFNGQMKVPEVGAEHYTATYWEYAATTGRRWNLDPKGNPSVSPYATFENNPIYNTDPLGDTSYPTPNGGRIDILDNHPETFDGNVQKVGSINVRPAKGTLRSFREANGGGPGETSRFVATFNSKSGEFAGYVWDGNMKDTYESFIKARNEDVIEQYKNADNPFYEHYNNREDALKSAINMGLTVVLPNPLLKTATAAANSAKVSGQGFESFSAFKKVYGTAGKGRAWHHIVEQTPGNITKFGNEAIHNTKNLLNIEHGAGTLHARISGYYSSKQFFTGGKTVRQWLSSQSFEAQFKFGIQKLKDFGWKP